jgi:hypothetical protein
LKKIILLLLALDDYDKKVSGKRTLTYDDIVEEAISFGWIDSLIRSLNDRQAMYYPSLANQGAPGQS